MGDMNCMQRYCVQQGVSVNLACIARLAWAFGADDLMMRNSIFATSGRNVGIRPHQSSGE